MTEADKQTYLSDMKMLHRLYQLKKQNADLNVARDSETGKTYLQEAARGGYVNSLRFLIQNGADVNYAPYDDSALMLATQSGQLKTMELLLQNKANMDAIFYDVILDIPESPLSYAKANHMVKAVELFMKYGAPCGEAELEIIKREAYQDQMIRARRSDSSLER